MYPVARLPPERMPCPHHQVVSHRRWTSPCVLRTQSRGFTPRGSLHCKAQRGVVILPGLGNNTKDYEPLAKAIRERGLLVDTAKIARLDWGRNAAGLLDLAYYRGALQPRPVVDWYLTRVDACVKAMQEATGGAPVSLLAHSAGGWLARVYLLGFGTAGIDRLVTLGSPHQPPPKEGVAFTVDQTRGILTHVTQTCPGRFHDEIEYITVAGKFIKGAGIREPGASLQQRVVGLGYLSVCGSASVWGDGVVPLPSAHLAGAKQLTLEGVYHSPLGSVAAADGAKPGRPWYGSPSVIDQWLGSIVADASELSESQLSVGDLVSSTVLPDS